MELRTFKLTLSIFSNISNFTAGNETDALLSEDPYQAVEIVIIILAAGSLSFVTITGNLLVILAIIINRNLQTINNYFILSLACTDLIIGVLSINLNTAYIVIGYWPLGPIVCDLWLFLDYVVCVAAVLNLLIISFDRYFCITKPLSYPARRTTRMAVMMIAVAWVVSFIMWAPAILFWQFIISESTVPEGECYHQFLSDVIFTCITSIASFFLPVAIMTFLYWQIYRASKSRVKTSKHKLKWDNQSSNKAGKHMTMPCSDDNVKTHSAERGQNDGTGGVVEEKPSAPVHPEENEVAETPAGYDENSTAHNLNATIPKQLPSKRAVASREKKVTRMIMVIIFALVVTWMPYHVMAIIYSFCSACVPSSMWTFCYWLCYINSAINPVCYALCNVTFKKTFKRLLLCQHKDIRLGK